MSVRAAVRAAVGAAFKNEALNDGADAAVMSMNFFADGDLTTIRNYVEQHNTAVGNRASRMYNDVQASQVAPNGLPKIGASIYNVWDDYNLKNDTFNADGAGATGNWAYSYSVGNRGNVCLFGRVTRGSLDAPANDNTDPYLGMAWLPSSEYNLLRAGIGLTQAQIMALFGNYTVGPQASPAIGGNYVPLSTSTYLKSRVPAGATVLKYDLAGTLRRTDGTGAAGAYESL